MVEVITDGAADLFPHTPKDVIKVPINVIWKDETIPFTGENREEIDKILKKARPGEVKTSQPSPKQILDALEGLEGDVIYVALSSKLSGTFSVARSVARIVKGRRINLHVVDSRSVSLGMGILVDLAIHLAEMGAKVEEVVKELETLREKIRIFFAVPTLDYLIAGGRIGIVKGIIANFLGLRPILKIEEGEVRAEKVVQEGKLWKEMASLAAKNVYTGYGLKKEHYKRMLGALKERGIKVLGEFFINPIILIHAGPGVVGYLYTV